MTGGILDKHVKIVDARSGRIVNVGDRVSYGAPPWAPGAEEWWRLLRVEEGVFRARALVDGPRGPEWVPLVVRRTHPRFPWQKVGFFPS